MEIRKLNMLRGIAALSVVVSHYGNRTQLLDGLFGQGAGQLGVMIFFILSGFLMSYLYMDRKKASRANVRYFAIARIARVVPLFVVVVLLSFLLPLLGIEGVFYHIPTVAELISHFALLSGASVLWTVSTEIQFYILFVWLWILQERRKSALYVFFVVVSLVLALYGLPAPKLTILGLGVDTKLFRSLPYFLIGIIFGQLYKSWKPPYYLQSGGFAWSLAVIPCLYPKIFNMLTGDHHKMWQDAGTFYVVSLVFFLVVFLVPDSNKFLSNPVGDFLGKISYSVYLLHLPILRLLVAPDRLLPGLHFVLFMGIVLVASQLSYSLIENPSRQFIRSLAAKA